MPTTVARNPGKMKVTVYNIGTANSSFKYDMVTQKT